MIGARPPLIAFNVNLATDRLDTAKAIAAAVRQSSGGLPFVKALGLPLEDQLRARLRVREPTGVVGAARLPRERVPERDGIALAVVMTEGEPLRALDVEGRGGGAGAGGGGERGEHDDGETHGDLHSKRRARPARRRRAAHVRRRQGAGTP